LGHWIRPPRPDKLRVSIAVEELTRRAEFLRNHDEVCTCLIGSFQSTRGDVLASPHLEDQLYGAFFPKEDEALMERFHNVPWSERLAIINAF